jgi:hypothetical protein
VLFMLAKRTSKNQITLPKAIIGQVARSDYFDVSVDKGRVVLTPVAMHALDEVYQQLERAGATEADVADAVNWSRQRSE